MKASVRRAGWTCAAAALLTMSLANPAAASDGDPPPDFIFELMDPLFCSVPPEEFSDEQMVAMMRDPDQASPVHGTVRNSAEWQVMGHGYFNTSSSGLVSGLELVLLDDDETLRFLCLAVVRSIDTSMTEGQASLVGMDVDTIDGDTFMVVAELGDRDNGEFAPLGVLTTTSGTFEVERTGEETMAGEITLQGNVDGLPGGEQQIEMHLTLDEIWKETAMNVVDWDAR